jgi:hypothetical protein
MVSIVSLWLPILLTAVIVFLISAVLHMVLRYHWGDFKEIPGESTVLQTIRTANVPPGDYAFPRPKDPKEMKTPEFQERYRQGPVGFLTVVPSGGTAMGKSLVQWFLYTLVVGVFVAYVTGRTVPPGAEYMSVFRVAGTVAFIAFAGSQPMISIWEKRSWSTTWKHVFDGFVYGLLTAGAFAGFWPGG